MTDPDLERVQRLILPRKRAAERLRRELAAIDGSSGHPYFRAFRRRTRGPAVTVARGDLERAAAAAELIFVGDFHALPACQSFAAELLGRVAAEVPKLALGVEFVYTRQQSLLDRRQLHGLDDEAFLKRLHYGEEWGYPWDGCRRLLDRARELELPVFALDRSPRGGYSGLRERDEHAARRVESILAADPERRLLVLFGESHLAPRHLPARVKSRLARAGRRIEPLVIFQNPDAIHWQLETSGLPHREATVRLDDSTFAVLHTPPLEKYEAYRRVLGLWQADLPAEEEVDFTPSVHHLIELLLEWLGIRAGRRRVRHRAGWSDDLVDVFPDVYSGAEARELLPTILAEQGRTPDEIREAREALVRREAIYDSRSNTLFLIRYRSGPVAGEAARFLRSALTGRLFIRDDDFQGQPIAATYGAAYNEALANLGAWLVDPTSEYRPTGPARAERQDDEELVARFLEAHRKYEGSPGRRFPMALKTQMLESRRLRRRLARDLGQRLGAVLFDRFRRGSLTTPQIRRLFTRPLEPASARRQLLRMLRGDAADRRR